MASVAIDDRRIPPDEAASRLFEEHSEWLLVFCTRQLRDRADAEDAVQATFLYAFRALRSGVVPECERAWLTTIAKNVCHMHRRTSRRRPESAVEPDLDRIAMAQPALEEVGFMDDVRAALTSLPENQRRALLRREWQGVPSSEIADELHLSAPATDALLFRARKSFATAMAASGRTSAGLNVLVVFEPLRGWLKPLLGCAAVKAAVATTAASVVVGGVVIEQQRSDSDVSAPPRPVRSAATVGATPEPSPAATLPLTTPVVTRNGQAAPPATAPTSRPARESGARGPAQTDTTVTHVVRPPKDGAVPPPATAPPPPAAQPSSPPPQPAPPADLPVPGPPVGLPPILGEEPPVQLPPPVEELLPPVAVPPLPLPPLPPLLPSLDEGLQLIP